MLFSSFPILPVWESMVAAFHGFWHSGDYWDGYFYNNQFAVGHQIYPSGIHLFHDMFSINGLFYWANDVVWMWTTTILSPLTFFVPIDII